MVFFTHLKRCVKEDETDFLDQRNRNADHKFFSYFYGKLRSAHNWQAENGEKWIPIYK